ncbi:class B sortase [Candidatus Dojkabacteria bacterium]|nr:class B sortase [Candidatus Dojkabacteria bacterium]
MKYANINIGIKITSVKLKIKKIKITTQLVLSILFSTCIIISIIGVGMWYLDSRQIDNEIEKINKVAKTTELDDNESSQLINPPSNQDSLYWKYTKIPLMDVDLKELEEINSDTVGWIQVLGTNINYPFVQSEDNSFYLNHSFSKKKNKAGWVFLDYRNNIKEIDKNNIIYAHSRVNTVLFSTLKNIMKSNWHENFDNHIIRVSTKHHNTMWQVFSVYQIPTSSDYLVIDFNDETTYSNFLSYLQNRSVFNFEVELSSKDKILTLSTCNMPTQRVVMHAKLIKMEIK